MTENERTVRPVVLTVEEVKRLAEFVLILDQIIATLNEIHKNKSSSRISTLMSSPIAKKKSTQCSILCTLISSREELR